MLAGFQRWLNSSLSCSFKLNWNGCLFSIICLLVICKTPVYSRIDKVVRSVWYCILLDLISCSRCLHRNSDQVTYQALYLAKGIPCQRATLDLVLGCLFNSCRQSPYLTTFYCPPSAACQIGVVVPRTVISPHHSSTSETSKKYLL